MLRVLFAVVVAATLVDAGAAQEPVGRVGIHVAERTDAGTFPGSWVYVNRQEKYALWFREHDGAIELRVGFSNTSGSERYETDWSGEAQYTTAAGAQATVSVRVTETNPDEVRGTWDRRVAGDHGTHSEHASFVLYRALDGRSLVLDLTDQVPAPNEADPHHPTSSRRVLQFTKVSKRLALWDELPF